MIIPHYDEFGIYTTDDDVKSYIENLLEKGEKEEEIFKKCKIRFGKYLINTIEYILYGN